jgi:hypothetical protein
MVIAHLPSAVIAGPSYSVECKDISRHTNIHLFDANPRSRFLMARGMHNSLPEGMESFIAASPNPTALTVTSYKAYEVELKLKPEGDSVYLVTDNEAKTKIGILERIILENHSEIKIQEQPRSGAVTLVLANGLNLRFNGCEIIGDVAVGDWEDTFKSTPPN